MLPWSAWADLGWRAVALPALAPLLRRLPAIVLLRPLTRDLNDVKDAVFAGWFGPIGIAALYYAVLVLERTGDPLAWHVASLAIFASVVAHGVTAAPGSRWYARAG